MPHLTMWLHSCRPSCSIVHSKLQLCRIFRCGCIARVQRYSPSRSRLNDAASLGAVATFFTPHVQALLHQASMIPHLLMRLQRAPGPRDILWPSRFNDAASLDAVATRVLPGIHLVNLASMMPHLSMRLHCHRWHRQRARHPTASMVPHLSMRLHQRRKEKVVAEAVLQ